MESEELKKDSHYFSRRFDSIEVEHSYGKRVHLLNDPFLTSVLARIGHPETRLPELNHYLEYCYQGLLKFAVNSLFSTKEVKMETRMNSLTPAGVFWGEGLDPMIKALVVDLARAGTFPSHVCFQSLHYICEREGLRQDHFYLNRKTNDQGQVIGVDATGSKIGGNQEGAFVFFPDPMGATGSSLSHCLNHYKNNVDGVAKKYVALHLIITPEYIKKISQEHPDVEIFAIRLDRGLSSEKALASLPGTLWEEEKGLNDIQYIVPGAGGVGETLNNSPV